MAVDTAETTSGQPAPDPDAPTGVWFHGARGSVATTAITGLLALRQNLVEPIGCVTERAPFDQVRLPSWSHLTVGGHDIVDDPLEKRAEQFVTSGVIPHSLYEAVRPSLVATEADLRTGYEPATQRGPQQDVIDRLAEDISEFRQRHGLARVIVVNVASTEPPMSPTAATEDLAALRRALRDPSERILRPSSIMAMAAFQSGCGFVDFTPSPGARLAAVDQAAREAGVPYAGSDGKTGESLLRAVLGPMFVSRSLRVLSWAGFNILGGGDGATLSDTWRAESKMRSKSGILPAILGTDVPAPLHIDYVPDLGERKTSWDHVSFEGFLGVRMSLQLTWQGLDSALAAPLVLDLARFVAAAHAVGVVGPIPQLAYFFKDPVGHETSALVEQERILADWATTLPRR